MTEKILTDEDGNEIDLEDEKNLIVCQQSGIVEFQILLFDSIFRIGYL